MPFDQNVALDFIANAELPTKRKFRGAVGMGPSDQVETNFETIKNQAAVVGQDVVAFESGTEKDFRKAISNSSLLAQLVANRKVADRKDIYAWYDAYFDVLGNLGWVVQENGWSTYEVGGSGVEVHEEIITLATVLLGPAPTALAIVKTTLDSLKKMDEKTPWLKIFGRESTHAEAARFQVSVVRKSPESGELLVTMMAFGLEAESKITQVLLFKFKKNEATLKNNSAQVSINKNSIAALAPAIEDKIRAYQKDYIASLPDL